MWTYVLLLMFFFPFFVSPRDLRAPSADRRETLPYDRKVLVFDNTGPKILGALPPQKQSCGTKTCKIWVDFGPLQSSIANISGTDRDIQNRKDMLSRAIHPAFGEKSPVNFGPLKTPYYKHSLTRPPKNEKKVTLVMFWCSTLAQNYLIRIIK